MYDLLEWIDQLFLRSSMMKEGSVVHSIIASSVFRVAEKLARIADMGPIIHPKALKMVTAMRGGDGYATHSGRCEW
jgi:hypothetical protein